MAIKEIPLESPIEEKIAWAEDCYKKIGDQLLGDERVADLLAQLKEAIHASHMEMAKVGIVDECRDCEQMDGGSCCGIGLEKKFNGTIILINLLLGLKFPGKRKDPSSCFFLGERGCLLLVRHVICVNYICKKIEDHIDPQKIAVLREKEGVELELLFLLNERIKKF